jgi:dihydroorotate dehydrogenase (NAD+) catalytic subunit
LSVSLCGIELEDPVVNASGTFDAIAARRAFGEALMVRFHFAAFVTKTVTVKARQGNPPPRLWELGGGMINSIGLPNKGLAGFLAHDLPELERLPVPLIVNVMGFTREEVAELVEAFSARASVRAIELNVSCPNVKTGMIMGADAAELTALLQRVRPLSAKPLLVKLTPNVSDIGELARAAEAAGADGLSLINTVRGMALHPLSATPWLGGVSGGVSGPAVRAAALALVDAVVRSVTVPVIGMGGVERGAHARDLLEVGAAAVAVGTASFRDPLAGGRVRRELRGLGAAAPGE